MVVIQIALMALVIFGPRPDVGLTGWTFLPRRITSIVAGTLMLAGVALLVAGALHLGRNLTPLPYPAERAKLLETGPYRLARHPMYAGGILASLGWVLWLRSWLTLGYAVILFVFIDLKSRREEKWLEEKFPSYPAYRKRVRRLIPFVY